MATKPYTSATISIAVMRAAYGINWFNFASVFTFVALDLKQDVSALGLVTGSYVLGAATFQLPGGLMASKLGAKRTLLLGLAIMSAGTVLFGFASDLNSLILSRFLVGISVGLTWSPSVSLMLDSMRRNVQGIGAAAFVSAFNIGAIVGLGAWGVIAESFGWRLSVWLGALLIAATIVPLHLAVSDSNDLPKSGIKLSAVRSVLGESRLNVLSLTQLGVQIGATTTGTFMAYYLATVLGVGTVLAGTLAGLTPFFSIISSFGAGTIYARIRNVRALIIAAGVATSVALAACSLNNVLIAVVTASVAGATIGIAATATLIGIREMSADGFEMVRLGWMNTIGMLGSVWPPVLFSFIAADLGFGDAWLLISVLPALFLIPFWATRGPAHTLSL